MRFGERIARFLVPEQFEALEKQRQDLDMVVNNRVADIVLKMDPFEPFLKKHHVIFSKEWQTPEEGLDEPSRVRLYTWAYAIEGDMSFKYLTDWIRNTQGNATVRHAKSDPEWFYGRAAIVTIELFIREIGRLSSHYKEMLAERDNKFDSHLTVE